MTERYDLQALAPNYNNINGLTPLHQLNPPLFKLYKYYINQRWVAQQSLATSGSRRQVKIGLPSTTWLFPSLTQNEYLYLRDTFVSGVDALVTMRTYDDEADSWKNFNAIMSKPVGTFDGIYWNNVEINFLDLREIT